MWGLFREKAPTPQKAFPVEREIFMKKTTYASDRLKREDVLKTLGNSSGMILEENGDTVTIGYVDFDVSDFGGRDYECFYELDSENTRAFMASLDGDIYEGDLFDRCVQAFSIKFSNSRFEDFCKEHGIAYNKKTY